MNSFECDKLKARLNYDKHKVRFTEAGRALNAGHSLTKPSIQSAAGQEERYTSIVTLPDSRTVVMVWTPRRGHMRIISVRHARKDEKEAFNAYLQKLH